MCRPFDERAEVPRPLRFVPGIPNRAARHHHPGKKRLDDERSAEALHEQRTLDRAAAKAAVLLVEQRAEPPEFSERVPVILAIAQFGRDEFAPRIERVATVEKA